MTQTIQQFKKEAVSQLIDFSPSPQLDVEVLMQFALNLTKTQLLLKSHNPISEDQLQWLNSSIEKRKSGLPVAYITGHKEFFGYDFAVSPAVLIPKPDTEILVEQGLQIIMEKINAHPNATLTVCDMCTGSGCIGIATLLSLIENQKVADAQLPKFTLIDISGAALEIAEENVKKLIPSQYQSRIRLVQSNLFEQFSQDGGWTFDVILTNPPYIPHKMVDSLLLDGRNEPRLALDGDINLFGDRALDENGLEIEDGLAIIRNLLPQAKVHLSPRGVILMETGEYNAKAAALLAKDLDFSTKIHKDLEGQLRVVECSAKIR
ncbi:MAG: peptide chain release factor N(5)-glutamine methyltransferase [Treponema sp.]|nr:peptide chain release factor N(5)-glutamine methyltransferase [Treponema sp.]